MAVCVVTSSGLACHVAFSRFTILILSLILIFLNEGRITGSWCGWGPEALAHTLHLLPPLTGGPSGCSGSAPSADTPDSAEGDLSHGVSPPTRSLRFLCPCLWQPVAWRPGRGRAGRHYWLRNEIQTPRGVFAEPPSAAPSCWAAARCNEPPSTHSLPRLAGTQPAQPAQPPCGQAGPRSPQGFELAWGLGLQRLGVFPKLIEGYPMFLGNKVDCCIHVFC